VPSFPTGSRRCRLLTCLLSATEWKLPNCEVFVHPSHLLTLRL
jgi:hypothetical protein